MASRSLSMFAFALLAAAASSSVVPTRNYIDTVTGYIDLSTCAEGVVSTVVRAQQSGCGDDEALTSYTCFCADSSSYFSHMISSEVFDACGTSSASAQASSAIAVFDSYCALGIEAGLSTTSDAASTQATTRTASPAADVTTAAATQTGAASTLATSTTSAATSSTQAAAESSSPDSSDSSRSTAIAAGVAVPVGVIGLALVGYLFYRKRVSAGGHHSPIVSAPTELNDLAEKHYAPQELSSHEVQELPYSSREVHELDGNARHEAEADAWKHG